MRVLRDISLRYAVCLLLLLLPLYEKEIEERAPRVRHDDYDTVYCLIALLYI